MPKNMNDDQDNRQARRVEADRAVTGWTFVAVYLTVRRSKVGRA